MFLQTIIAEEIESNEMGKDEKNRKSKFLPNSRKRKLKRKENDKPPIDLFEYGTYRIVDRESSYFKEVTTELEKELQAIMSNEPAVKRQHTSTNESSSTDHE